MKTKLSSSSERERFGDSTILCTCAKVRCGDFRDAMKRHPDTNFEVLLELSGTAQECTACRLDAEYLYAIDYPRVATARDDSVKPGVTKPLVLSWRQRLWQWLDSVTPMVPLLLTDWPPVIGGTGIQQLLVVANDQFLYRDEHSPVPLNVTVDIFDSSGVAFTGRSYVVSTGETIDVQVPQFLNKSNFGSLVIGSMRMTRRWSSPNVQGTSRPQIVLRGRIGLGGVHTQGANGPSDKVFTHLWCPADEREFFSIVNPESRPLTLKLRTPLPFVENHSVLVPPRGAYLHEISMDCVSGTLVDMGVCFNGLNKRHVFCATPDLGAISIDHPAIG